MKNLKIILLILAFGIFSLANAISFEDKEIPNPILYADNISYTMADEALRGDIINLLGNHEFDHFMDVKTLVYFKLNKDGSIKILNITLNHYNDKKIKAFILEALHDKNISFNAPHLEGFYLVPIKFKKTD